MHGKSVLLKTEDRFAGSHVSPGKVHSGTTQGLDKALNAAFLTQDRRSGKRFNAPAYFPTVAGATILGGMTTTEMILALDFGGTKLTAGVVRGAAAPSQTRTWEEQGRVSSPPKADATSDIEMMLALGHELLSGARPTAM